MGDPAYLNAINLQGCWLAQSLSDTIKREEPPFEWRGKLNGAGSDHDEVREILLHDLWQLFNQSIVDRYGVLLIHLNLEDAEAIVQDDPWKLISVLRITIHE